MRLRKIGRMMASAMGLEVHRAQGLERPIVVNKDGLGSARFCFLGEFGYELVSWIPYLLFLKQQGLTVRTASRPGSSLHYYFSDDHVEVRADLIGDGWGTAGSYRRLQEKFPGETLVHPGEAWINRRFISVCGYEWTTKDIHCRIEETNYAKPSYEFVAPFRPVKSERIVTLSNKYFVQWPHRYTEPINYYTRAELIELRDLLRGWGFGVVYNHFVEKNAVDEHRRLEDEDLFGDTDDTFDMRTFWAGCKDTGERMRAQVGLYNASTFVIGPQGGNVYLPCVMRKPVMMLMRAGDYIDYMELSRLYEIPFESFYEVRHMMSYLKSNPDWYRG